MLVVGLVIASFHRYASRAEAVIFRDQPIRDQRVRHALADLARDEFREHVVGGLIGESVVEIAQPDGEAGRGIELLEQGFAVFRTGLGGLARIGDVHEAAFGCAALREDIGIARADACHFFGVYRGVVER